MAGLSDSVRQQVFARTGHRCEYCLTSRRVIGMPLVVDHIVPKALGGTDDPDNLCAACYRCNEYKGVKTHGLDPVSGEFVPLFHPRVDLWRDHLTWTNGGTHIAGLTATGLGHAIRYVPLRHIPPGADYERRMAADYDPEIEVVVTLVQATSEDTYRLASPRLAPPAAYAQQNEVKH